MYGCSVLKISPFLPTIVPHKRYKLVVGKFTKLIKPEIDANTAWYFYETACYQGLQIKLFKFNSFCYPPLASVDAMLMYFFKEVLVKDTRIF